MINQIPKRGRISLSIEYFNIYVLYDTNRKATILCHTLRHREHNWFSIATFSYSETCL